MYKELPKVCKCTSKMLEVLAYDELPQTKSFRAFRKGWLCLGCNKWEAAILRERVVEETQCMSINVSLDQSLTGMG
jgi:hypothetical protein